MKICYTIKLENFKSSSKIQIRLGEKEVLVNEIDTLECILGHLFNLKPGGDGTRVIGIAEANNNYQQANRLRKQLIKIQGLEEEISTRIRKLD